MVSRDNVIETSSKCVCGYSDKENVQKNYFENKCPNCGKEGTLQVETLTNIEKDNHINDSESTDDSNLNADNTSTKIVCKNCRSEFCGQDGYDLLGGTRSSLKSVNPNEITEDSDEEVSEEEEEDTKYMSGWEGLCDLLRPLDAMAMMVQRGDFVFVKKIEMPQTAKLWAYEGINVVDDSVTVTDYTPEIYNTFVIKWGEEYENELEFVFEKHKQLFGERKTVMEAKKYVSVSEDEEDDEKKEDEGILGGVLTSITDWIVGSSEESLKKNTDKLNNNDKNNVDLENVEGLEDEEDSNVEEIPITDKDEAIQFGITQVGKAKRDDGHTIELKVIGSQNWQMGEWCHVKLPSFNEDSYMFISKCSFESGPDTEYINTLKLVDYPPSLGKPQNNTEKKNDEETTEDSENTENNDGTTNSNSESSSSSSSGTSSNT